MDFHWPPSGCNLLNSAFLPVLVTCGQKLFPTRDTLLSLLVGGFESITNLKSALSFGTGRIEFSVNGK